jgi:hypothetical protein
VTESNSPVAPPAEIPIERGRVSVNLPLAVVLLSVNAFQFGMPAAVVGRLLPNNLYTIGASVLAYCFLLFDVFYTTVLRTRNIYDPERPFQPTVRARLTPSQWGARAKRVVVIGLFGEYVKMGYVFGLAYAAVSRLDPHAFNVPLGVGAAFYFSVTTLATVGYGDIVPVSAIARTIAVVEIFVGLLYVILVFSVVATHLQKRSAP